MSRHLSHKIVVIAMAWVNGSRRKRGVEVIGHFSVIGVVHAVVSVLTICHVAYLPGIKRRRAVDTRNFSVDELRVIPVLWGNSDARNIPLLYGEAGRCVVYLFKLREVFLRIVRRVNCDLRCSPLSVCNE